MTNNIYSKNPINRYMIFKEKIREAVRNGVSEYDI